MQRNTRQAGFDKFILEISLTVPLTGQGILSLMVVENSNYPTISLK